MNLPQIPWGIELPILIVVYIVILIVIANILSRRKVSVSVSDFFVANRTVGFLLLATGLFATIASGNTFLGYSGQAYRTGGLSFILAAGFYIAILLGYFLLGVKLIPIALKNNFVTPGDYIVARLKSNGLMLLLLILMFWCTFVQFFEQSIALGWISTSTSAGYIPYWLGALIFMIATIALILFTGFRGTAVVNFIMGIIMIVALLGLVFVIFPVLGGSTILSKYVANTLANSPQNILLNSSAFYKKWFSTSLFVAFGIMAYFQIWLYLLATKDLTSLRRQFTLSIPIYLIVPTVFVIGGIMGLVLFPGLDKLHSDNIMIYLLAAASNRTALAYIFSEIMLIGVISATLSTAISTTLAFSTIIAKDFYKRLINPKADDKTTVKVTRIAIIIVGALGFLIAMTPRLPLWEWVVLKFQIGMQAVPAILLSMYIPWVNKKGSWIGSIVGGILAIFSQKLPTLLGFDMATAGFFINIILVLLVSYLTKSEEEEKEAKQIINA